MNEGRGRLTIADTTSALTMLGMLPLSIDVSRDDSLLPSLSRVHRLTVYNTVFLVIAKRRGLELATFDVQLQKAATAGGVALL